MPTLTPVPLTLLEDLAAQYRAKQTPSRNGYKRDPPPDSPSYEEIEAALSHLPAHFGPNSYETWLKVLMAVHSALPGADGAALCERYIPGYEGEVTAKFEGFEQGSGVGIGTLFYIAGQHGYRPRRGAPREAYDATRELTDNEIAAIVEGRPLHNAYPYAIRDGRLVRYVETADGPVPKPIADFTAQIAEEITTEEGAKTFVIAGDGIRGGAYRLELDAMTFGHDSRLKAALEAAVGARDPVRSDMAKHLGPAIKLLTDDLCQFRRYERTGWARDVFLVPGRERSGVQIELPRKLPYRTTSADIDAALTTFEALLDSVAPALSTAVISMVLQAPLHRLARWHNERYGVFIQGRTGSLKTSFAQTAMCLYGHGFAQGDSLIKWGEGATRNAVMALATAAHDMPLLIDNYKPNTGAGDRDFINLIHNILEGGEKDRLTRSAVLRSAKPVHCFPLITGEDTPDTDPASLARILVLTFEWQRGEVNEQLNYAQNHSHLLPAIGDAWITFLESAEGRQIIGRYGAQLQERRAVWAAELRRRRPDMANILRVATNLATNELTWRIAEAHPTIGALARKYSNEHASGLRAIAENMAEQTSEALEAHRFLNALNELLATQQYTIIDRNRGLPNNDEKDRMLGWVDYDGIYLLPDVALRAVKALLGPGGLAVSQRTLYAQLAGLNMLAAEGSTRTTVRIKILGKQHRVLHLMPNAVSPEVYQQELSFDEINDLDL